MGESFHVLAVAGRDALFRRRRDPHADHQRHPGRSNVDGGTRAARRRSDAFGPILWQLPATFRFDPERFEAFFDLLPRSTDEAARIARRHDRRLGHRAWLQVDKNRPLRHALEVRHPSFQDSAFIKLLRRHRIGLVVSDAAGKWPFMEDVTADFVYVRLHGAEELYASGYTDAALKDWVRKIRTWSRGGNPKKTRTHAPPPRARASGRDAFAYFDNDAKVHAPFDASQIAEKLGVNKEPPERPS